jgi:hypothetical protein
MMYQPVLRRRYGRYLTFLAQLAHVVDAGGLTRRRSRTLAAGARGDISMQDTHPKRRVRARAGGRIAVSALAKMRATVVLPTAGACR